MKVSIAVRSHIDFQWAYFNIRDTDLDVSERARIVCTADMMSVG